MNLRTTQDAHRARTTQTITRDGLHPTNAEWRLKELGIDLPAPPEPFGTYVEAVQTGNLLFPSGMFPTEGRSAKFVGHVPEELDLETARQAARLAALNGLAVAREYLGSLDRVTRIVRLGAPSLLRATSAISRKSRTARRSCCKPSSEDIGFRHAWCAASQAFRWARR